MRDLLGLETRQRVLFAISGTVERLSRAIRLRNRHVFLADCIAIPSGVALAFALRFDGLDSDVLPYLIPGITFAVLALAVKPPIMRAAGMYAQAWRYVGRREAIAMGGAVFTSSILLAVAMLAVFSPNGLWEIATGETSPGLPRTVLVIDMLLSIFLFGTIRLGAKILSGNSAESPAAQVLHAPSAISKRVLLVGAGDAGATIAAELRSDPGLGMLPVGFVDDDPVKQGIFVQGLKVLGTRKDIPALAKKYSIEQALITMPTAPGRVLRDALSLCEEAGVSCRTVPGIYDLIGGSVHVGQTREVRIEDLLRREPADLDVSAVAHYLSGATVLVSGAGGSIGTELCRNIARFSPETLLLLGHGENSIHQAHTALQRQFPELSLVPIIADVRDSDRIRSAMDQYRPSVVFHAAAHKHVPLMELHLYEVISNNVFGTYTLAREAERAGVDRLVFVSTDKAANPVNFLGVTKRLGEMIVCNAAHRTGRSYAAVRFGNVLGSRGSVVPIFLDQIAHGGPITVTHPEATRYFMTIPEAAHLIIQAGALSFGGEVFILDMGEPVRIVDLANDLLRLSGPHLVEDIRIEFTGLRPGEKLHEALLSDVEKLTANHHDGMLVAVMNRIDELDHQLLALEDLVRTEDAEAIIAKLRELVPEFKPAETETGRVAIRDRLFSAVVKN